MVACDAERAGSLLLVMPRHPGEGCGAPGDGVAGRHGQGEQTRQEIWGFFYFFFFLPHLHVGPCNSEYSRHGRQRGGFAISLLYVLIYSAAVS